jgi:hypothetical protein
MAPLMFLVLALFLRPCRNRVPIKFSVALGSTQSCEVYRNIYKTEYG